MLLLLLLVLVCRLFLLCFGKRSGSCHDLSFLNLCSKHLMSATLRALSLSLS